jgi:hypothetical protein
VACYPVRLHFEESKKRLPPCHGHVHPFQAAAFDSLEPKTLHIPRSLQQRVVSGMLAQSQLLKTKKSSCVQAEGRRWEAGLKVKESNQVQVVRIIQLARLAKVPLVVRDKREGSQMLGKLMIVLNQAIQVHQKLNQRLVPQSRLQGG